MPVLGKKSLKTTSQLKTAPKAPSPKRAPGKAPGVGSPVFCRVHFPVPARDLYALYMDARRHSEAIGSAVTLAPKVGGAYSSWDGYITGKTLALEPGKTIIQTWRSSDFKEDEADSILILQFRDEGGKGILDMTHTGLPAHQEKSVAKGWEEYYWKPWKVYLANK